MGEFYCESTGKPLSNFNQGSDIIWFVFSKDASECVAESRLKKGKLILPLWKGQYELFVNIGNTR